MRTILMAGAALAALGGTTDASAGERVIQRGPGVMHAGPRPGMRPMTPAPAHVRHHAPRWGSKVGGRWWGGVNAPGGWNAYRRPVRGWAVPVYWNTPRFFVSDWSSYGLSQPQPGRQWTRYYDDAVLIDSRGSVYDTVGNVDWDRDDRAYDGRSYDDDSYDRGGQYADERGYPDDDRGYQRRDNGVGGALAGAAVGGVAGALIGGRGDRLGGALIGGGVGALAGLAIDKAEDRGHRAPPPRSYADGYGAPYPQQRYGPAPGYPPRFRYPLAQVHGGGHWVSPDGGTTVVTSGGGYGGSMTTITVQSAPVVTTTTTEIYEDHVTWSRPIAHKKVWKPRRKATCYCRRTN